MRHTSRYRLMEEPPGPSIEIRRRYIPGSAFLVDAAAFHDGICAAGILVYAASDIPQDGLYIFHGIRVPPDMRAFI